MWRVLARDTRLVIVSSVVMWWEVYQVGERVAYVA